MGEDLVKTVPLVFYRNGERVVVGEASVYEDGRIEGIITQPTPLDLEISYNSFAVGYELHKDSILSGYSLADKLKARVDEWQPVRDFIKEEAYPTIMPQKEWLEKVALPQEPFPFLATMKDRMERDIKAVLKPIETYQEKARRLVYDYVKARLEKTDKHVTFAQDEVYVVWFSKTLQNWKCLISTTLPDGMYYEVTYNGDQHETYIDAYKFDNVCVKDPDVGVYIPFSTRTDMIELYDPLVPESIEAVELTLESLDWVVKWCKGGKVRVDGIGLVGAEIPTLQGKKLANFGSYIARKRNGDFIIMQAWEIKTKYQRRK